MKSIKNIAAEVRNQISLLDIVLLDSHSQQNLEIQPGFVQQARHSVDSSTVEADGKNVFTPS